MRHFSMIILLMAAFCVPEIANGQGLIFRLPEDGKGVEYEGTVTYENTTDDATDDDADGIAKMTMERRLTIKSVGKVEEEFNGTVHPCRWIEIVIQTGRRNTDATIAVGKVGYRAYRVLVPESKVLDTTIDEDTIPNIVLPIVRGYRRGDSSSNTVPLKAKALAFYPTICQLTHYPSFNVVAEVEEPDTAIQDQSFPSRHLTARFEMQRPESFSINEAHLWVSDQSPFGLARWEVTVTVKKKESTAPVADFIDASTVTTEMKISRLLENQLTEFPKDDN